MTQISSRLSKAISAGRRQPATREQVLARLLIKRAAAYRAGLTVLERSLRDQIHWSLPIRNGEAAAAD